MRSPNYRSLPIRFHPVLLTAILLLLGFSTDTAMAQPLADPIYDPLKANFLNIDPTYYSEVKFSDYFGDSSQDFPQTNGQNLLIATIKEGFGSKRFFGGTHWCDNATHGTKSLCRYITGGGDTKGRTCGSSVKNNYDYALNNPDLHCSPGQFAPWAGVNLWLGAGSQKTFVLSSFEELKYGPANRMCFEVEVDPTRLSVPAGSNPDFAQLVNPAVSHDNIDWISSHMGTYTSSYKSDAGTNDKETGGTYQRGGTHFYHNLGLSGQRYPLDKIYALNQDTIVACFGPTPSGVRGDMRPPYFSNPLATVVGEDANGHTDAYAYLPYLTRIYFHLKGGNAMHGLDVKFNKVFVLYERNDVFAMSGKGAVLGVNIVEAGQTAEHPFTIYNNAAQNRDYRIIMMAAPPRNLPLSGASSHFRLFIDANGNRKKDANETQELIPNQTITLTAQTDLALVALHTPNFAASKQQRYGRKFAQAHVTFQQPKRMRSAMYSMRTFRGNAADVQNKSALLEQMVYRNPTGEYARYKKFNQEKPNNTRLVRATPDFQMALLRMAARPADTTPPAAPQGLQAVAVSENVVDLSWSETVESDGWVERYFSSEALESDGWVEHYLLYRDGVQIATLGGKFPPTFYSDQGLIGSTTYQYQVSAVNGSGLESAKSTAVPVITPADTNPPTIVSAASSIENPTTVVVVYNEPVETASATNVLNYSVNIGGVAISNATLAADQHTVTLRTSELFGLNYLLTVNNVRDRGNPANTIIANTQVAFTIPALIDFGGTKSGNTFGLPGWTTAFQDKYNRNTKIGPGGSSSYIKHNGGYNYQGIYGTARNFVTGETVVVTWYNNTANAITFTPKISFDTQSRPRSGTWSDMTQVTVPPAGTASSSFTVDSASAGNYQLVNINNSYMNTSAPNLIICDKIELRTGGTSTSQPPVADFGFSPSGGQTPLPVSVDASASSDPDGNINSYAWNFGDGRAGSGKTANHTYALGGSYTITLTVTDDTGTIGSISKTIQIQSADTVPPAAPSALRLDG